MNTRNDIAEYNRIMDEAHRRAAQLRRDAIGEFWCGAGDAARRALRSAQRLAGSLARHAWLRGHQGV